MPLHGLAAAVVRFAGSVFFAKDALTECELPQSLQAPQAGICEHKRQRASRKDCGGSEVYYAQPVLETEAVVTARGGQARPVARAALSVKAARAGQAWAM
jgi:hypothetical protein